MGPMLVLNGWGRKLELERMETGLSNHKALRIVISSLCVRRHETSQHSCLAKTRVSIRTVVARESRPRHSDPGNELPQKPSQRERRPRERGRSVEQGKLSSPFDGDLLVALTEPFDFGSGEQTHGLCKLTWDSSSVRRCRNRSNDGFGVHSVERAGLGSRK